MTPERHQQIKKLFVAACELDGNVRAAFLEQACKNDAALRAEVESLLKHHDPATILKGKPVPIEPLLASPEDEATDTLAHGAGSAPSSLSEPPARLSPGTLIGNRYRIASRLGGGGMGEVYRAEDLKLHRTVALKFILHDRARQPAWLARFFNEARLASAVTHPRICRIYDIGEADGEAYISMEFIAGEDLSSLLKRIGRLPVDKAIELTRQLCYGLAAAHTQGVLHRDLKPANVMIDESGHAKITDFGIASLTTDAAGAFVEGTLAYMPPELLQGQPPTVRADLFSLGLILYEMVTGQRGLTGKTAAGEDARKAPTPPGQIVPELDPAFERIILACIDPNPRNRPASVYDVLAALPGGDPLAVAIAAGETPPPELLAAVRPTLPLRPALAIACAAFVVACLLAIVCLADRTLLLSDAGLSKSPYILEERAQQIIQTFCGIADAPGRSRGFAIDHRRPASMGARFDTPSHASHAALTFDYEVPAASRSSSSALGGISVRLDPAGRLRRFTAVPIAAIPPGMGAPTPDWPQAFQFAGLDIASFKSAANPTPPPVYAREARAWEAFAPGVPFAIQRVEAASIDGCVVYFRTVATETGTTGTDDTRPAVVGQQVLNALFLLALLAAVPLAWRNRLAGRTDRRGARRLAAAGGALTLLLWLMQHGPFAGLDIEFASLFAAVRTCVFVAGAIFLYYLAMEPYVRRFWPHVLLSWSRLVSGRFADPVVGRDILAGLSVGCAVVLAQQVAVLVSQWIGRPSPLLLPALDLDLGQLAGFRHTVGTLAHALLLAMGRGLLLVMLMLLARLAVRIPWLAAVCFTCIVTIAIAIGSDTGDLPAWTGAAAIAACVAFLMLRFGLLAAATSLLASRLIVSNPITLNAEAWFAGTTAFTLLALIATLGIGIYSTVAVRRNPFTVR